MGTVVQKLFAVYNLTNAGRTVLYTGCTRNLPQRVQQHKDKIVPGFTARYNVDRLVYYEVGEGAEQALTRERQIKAGFRNDKIDLINGMNPNWRDLSEDLTS